MRGGRRHPTHAHLDRALEWIARVRPKRAILTNMHIDLDFGAALVVIPAVMLVSMAPISFAGWGVREGAMIFGLGLLGIAATDALAVSVAFGILQLMLGLPGGALWLARGGKRLNAALPAVRSPAQVAEPASSSSPPSP